MGVGVGAGLVLLLLQRVVQAALVVVLRSSAPSVWRVRTRLASAVLENDGLGPGGCPGYLLTAMLVAVVTAGADGRGGPRFG